MAWVKVPPEHHPIFHAALPKDLRVETMNMFGGVAAKVNGHIFAGLFGRSTILCLPEPLKSEALALEGAGPFDPMGDGRAMSDKVMLPEAMMEEPLELQRWIARAFEATAVLPPKKPKPAKAATAKKTGKPEKTKKTGNTTKSPAPAAPRKKVR
jgi:hypothetical protein